MSALRPVVLLDGVQLLRGVLPNRLEHQVPAVGEAKEALLNERLEAVEVGVAHFLRRPERAAASEDRKPAEQLLLTVREEVVAPVDCRPKGALSLRGITTATSQER